MGAALGFDAGALLRPVLALLPVAVLSALALYFGSSLRAGRTPLIEQIARVSDPLLSPDLCRYTRRLTVLWCAYFIGAALLSAWLGWRAPWPTPWPRGLGQILISSGAVLLFVGEHRLRPYFFPGHAFPSLLQQLRDTRRVWGAKSTRPPSSASSS